MKSLGVDRFFGRLAEDQRAASAGKTLLRQLLLILAAIDSVDAK